MIKNFVPSEWKEEEYYELLFFVDDDGGWAFPCDKDGHILEDEMTDAAKNNYLHCLVNPQDFKYYKKVKRRTQRYKENARGTCNCGEEIELYNEYMGACECPNCGQWWNLFGQELNPVETWASGSDW